MQTQTHTENTPRAWVGCLGCYNAGELVGKWLDKDEAQDLQAAGLMSSDGHCVRCDAEEFWVFDHENIGNCGEMNPAAFVTIAERFETIAEHFEQDALRFFIGYYSRERDDINDIINDFEEAYAGQFNNREDWAHQFAEDTGLLESVPDSLQYYIDLDKWARDLHYGGEIDFADDGTGGVFVFWTR